MGGRLTFIRPSECRQFDIATAGLGNSRLRSFESWEQS
jgi:hypothetical protein